jgi:glutamate carboxypeptidase
MKGGDVILLYALRAIADAGQLDKMNVTVVFDGDEGIGEAGEAARRALVDAVTGARYAPGFETARGSETAVISRRSAGSWNLRTTGSRALIGDLLLAVGAGAVAEASRILLSSIRDCRRRPPRSAGPPPAARS